MTIWGTQPKYLREMTEWWKATNGDQKLLRSITRATREAGKYTITWVDAGAVVILLAAVTGVVLWLALPKRRRLGIVATVLGLAVCLIFYWMMVP